MTLKSNIVFDQAPAPRPGWIKRIITMFDVRKTRIDLSKLTDDQLRDIGLTRTDVEAELAKPFWKVPNHWLRP